MKRNGKIEGGPLSPNISRFLKFFIGVYSVEYYQ